MLDTLHRIVQEVTRANDLSKALQLLTSGVRKAIQADVCSVYLTDFDSREHVLAATEGLRPEAVGKVRLPMHRGLIGLVAERAEPLNLDDATSHPRYLYIPHTGETEYHGFLGVPIIQYRTVLGVLVVRQQQPRQFEDEEVTFLFTLAAQLAGAIKHAQASGELATLTNRRSSGSHFMEGRGSATGVAIGTGLVTYETADLGAVPDRAARDIPAERQRLLDAVDAVENELQRMKQRLADTLSCEDQALFDALIMMLNSDSLITRTIELIDEGNWAPAALRDTIGEHARIFDAMEDRYLRERGSDVRNLGNRVLKHLELTEPGGSSNPTRFPEQTILVGDEISVMQLAEVPREKLVGLVSARGSNSSHVAILARAMGIPAVMGVSDLPVNRMEARELIIDGYRGRVYVSPPPSVFDEYQRLADEERALSHELQALRELPAETVDGVRIPLMLNTGLVLEQQTIGAADAEGIGLYRTELPFMVRDSFPGENVQTINYHRVISEFAPRPVTLRTLDIGGDKPLPYFPIEESNPFLGWRGIRILLDHPEIFLTQIRAMLRASVGFDNLHIMLPMITLLSEVDDALNLIHRAHDELIEEGYELNMPKLGVMIEVPAAAYQAEALAERVDFISIGSNDLTQYLLAVDRNNSHVARLYDDLHPVVLQTIRQITTAATAHDTPVSICGELAGNPAAAPLLLGMGVSSLSMSSGSLLRVKAVIRATSLPRAHELLRSAMRCHDGDCVRKLMEHALDGLGLGGLVRPGR